MIWFFMSGKRGESFTLKSVMSQGPEVGMGFMRGTMRSHCPNMQRLWWDAKIILGRSMFSKYLLDTTLFLGAVICRFKT